MSNPTTAPVPSTRVSGTIVLDVRELVVQIVDQLAPRLAAVLAPADDRNGPYIPDLPRKVPPQRGDHGPGGERLVRRACPSCGTMMYGNPEEPEQLCAECQQHGDMRERE